MSRCTTTIQRTLCYTLLLTRQRTAKPMYCTHWSWLPTWLPVISWEQTDAKQLITMKCAIFTKTKELNQRYDLKNRPSDDTDDNVLRGILM